jgi:hypothetical protein
VGTRKDWLDSIAGDVERTWPPRTPANDADLTTLIEQCCQWQVNFGVNRLILPAPLIADPLTDLADYLRWVDGGLHVAKKFNIPPLVSCPISEACLPFQLQPVLDQLAAREEAAGIYFCVETSPDNAAVSASPAVANAYLEASYLLGQHSRKEVVINYADVFGLACLAVGATAFAGGYETRTRRLNLDDFVEREGGGGAFPRFFSLSTNTFYRPTRDMERIRDARLLARFLKDETPSSRPLLEALRQGASASSVPSWREGRQNVAAARAHFIERLIQAVPELTALEPERRPERTLNWLQDAEMTTEYLNVRFRDDPLDDPGRQAHPWRLAFEEFVRKYGLL